MKFTRKKEKNIRGILRFKYETSSDFVSWERADL